VIYVEGIQYRVGVGILTHRCIVYKWTVMARTRALLL
jgi:hypothetical protein